MSFRSSSQPIRNKVIQSRPVIGVCASKIDSDSILAILARLSFYNVDALLLLDNQGRNALEDIACVNGVIIMGDDKDIHPKQYGISETQIHPKTDLAACESTAYRLRLINLAFNLNMPLLGICAGMQAINVANHAIDGGTLLQHVPDVLNHNRHYNPEMKRASVLSVTLSPECMLSSIAFNVRTSHYHTIPALDAFTNAIHHQAVDKVRQGFMISAISNEGIIMAIEPSPRGKYAGKPVLGVQWHPEFLDDVMNERIIAYLVEQAIRGTEAINIRHNSVKCDAEISGSHFSVPDSLFLGSIP